jgi:SAM-dependent methyltransferase
VSRFVSVGSQAGHVLERLIGEGAKRRAARALDPLFAAAYRGDAVECTCCKRTFRSFKSFAGNAQCPYCGVLERHRLLWLYLERESNLLAAGNKLLHLAPERGFEGALKRQSALDYVSADLDPKKADVEADITHLPFADETFDWVLCSHVLEHVPEDVTALSQLCRVLKLGGTAIIMYPVDYSRRQTYEDFTITDPEERRKAFDQHDHVRVHGADHADRLVAGGFEVHVERYLERLSEDEIERYGLRPPSSRNTTDEIYLCRRPA